MNILRVLKDIEEHNPFLFEQLEKDAQLNYKVYKDYSIAKCWMQAVLESLDKAGYAVRPSQGIEKIGSIDNVVYLRNKV